MSRFSMTTIRLVICSNYPSSLPTRLSVKMSCSLTQSWVARHPWRNNTSKATKTANLFPKTIFETITLNSFRYFLVTILQTLRSFQTSRLQKDSVEVLRRRSVPHRVFLLFHFLFLHRCSQRRIHKTLIGQ